MFPKLILIITVAGAISCVLLVNRQQRIDAIHEMSQVHHRLLEHEHALWSIQIEIARRCRPEELREALEVEHALALKSIPAGPPPVVDNEVRLADSDRRQWADSDIGG